MKSWLRKSLINLDRRYSVDASEDVEFHAAAICNQASAKAAALGLTGVAGRTFAYGVPVPEARQFISECIAAGNTEAEFLTTQQVESMTNLSERTIRRRVNDGTFPPPIKFGRATRWRRLDIENYNGSYS